MDAKTKPFTTAGAHRPTDSLMTNAFSFSQNASKAPTFQSPTPWNDASSLASKNTSQTNALLQGSQPLAGNWAVPKAFDSFGQESDTRALDVLLRHHSRPSDESTQYQNSMNSWPDSPSVHSPIDDRRGSIANSESGPFANPWASGIPSRNPSQPPSRGGGNPSKPWGSSYQYGFQTAARGHQASTSSASGASFPDRQNSVHSEGPSGLYRNNSHTGLERTFDRLQLTHADNEISQQASTTPPYLRTLQGYGNGSAKTPSPYTSNTPPSELPQRTAPRMSYTPLANDFRQPSYFNHNGTSSAPEHVNGITTPADFDHAATLRSRMENVQNPNSFHLANPHTIGLYQQAYNGGYTSQQALQQMTMMNANALAAMSMGYNVPQAPLNQMAMYQPQFANGIKQGSPIPSHRDKVSVVLASFKAQAARATRNKQAGIKSDRTEKVWTLDEIIPHLEEFCGDQEGSRFLQSQLITANSEQKATIWEIVRRNCGVLALDVFGNYVLQQLLEHGDWSIKHDITDIMLTRWSEMAHNNYGCRVVQKVLDVVSYKTHSTLIEGFGDRDAILELCTHNNGNHVIQKVCERVKRPAVQPVLDAIEGNAHMLSRHQYGCRVIQRVIEHGDFAMQRAVIDELYRENVMEDLILDQYGNYVAQEIIKHAPAADKAIMTEKVIHKLPMCGTSKFATHVVEACLGDVAAKAHPELRTRLLHKMIETPDAHYGNLLGRFMRDGFGNYIVRTYLPYPIPFRLQTY